jgi:hypothetical protein
MRTTKTAAIDEQGVTMNIVTRALIFICAGLMLSACATHRTQKIKPTAIMQAQEEIPEAQLLDVDIAAFESAEVTEEQAEKEGTHPEIRKAECNFIPFHLKNTLQQSSQWGSVRVTPTESEGSDLLVAGEIVESNGEYLILKIDVSDATGTTWLQKRYKARIKGDAYDDNQPGNKDPFQDLYNTIANDIAAFKNKLDPAAIQKIRTVSKLKFARDFAPDTFGDYLTSNGNGKTSINRIPADNDAMMERLLKIRERDAMYLDTLNQYYEGFYYEMWPSYENWRKLNLTERVALAEVKRSEFIRKVGGALMIALAIGLEAGDVNNTNVLKGVLVLSGGQVIMSGINISKQAEIHSAAIKELGDSFGSEMKPVVMEYQGKEYELTGSAQEQYARWRELLRKIYFTETGFDPTEGSETESPAVQ